MKEMTKAQEIKTGYIVESEGGQYRVLSVQEGFCQLVRMNTTKLEILLSAVKDLLVRVCEHELTIYCEATDRVADESQMSADAAKTFADKLSMVQRVIADCKGDFSKLTDKRPKPVIRQCMEDYGFSKSTVWRILRQYLQSGCVITSLLDKRSDQEERKKPQEIHRVKKNGRKSQYGFSSDVIVDEKVTAQFEDILALYKKHRQMKFEDAYNCLLCKYYEKNALGIQTSVPLSKCPTFNQFYYYCSCRLSAKDKAVIKTSRAEYRNNCRALFGSARKTAVAPGWIVEVDAWEADIYLRSEADPSKTIGRPYVYSMVDVCTGAIVAVSVAFENNSMLGLTNLFLNLFDDMERVAEKYGMKIPAESFPSNFIPHIVRCDRGSDFISDKFEKLCRHLDINREPVTGATGSYKGIVEQSFNQFRMHTSGYLEGKGLIQKRYDSDHKETARLTKWDFTRLVLEFVVFHNNHILKDYPVGKKMVDAGIQPSPVNLWKYFSDERFAPRPIPENGMNQILFDLLEEASATLSTGGIVFRDLKYMNFNDYELMSRIEAAARKSVQFPIRIDPRDTSCVYYSIGSRLAAAPLNPNIPNQDEFAHMTWAQYKDYEDKKRELRAQAKHENRVMSVASVIAQKQIINAADTAPVTDATDIRAYKTAEKYADNYDNRISERMDESITGNAAQADSEPFASPVPAAAPATVMQPSEDPVDDTTAERELVPSPPTDEKPRPSSSGKSFRAAIQNTKIW